MDWKPTYKVESEVKPSDREICLCKVGGNFVGSVPLVRSNAVAKGRSHKGYETIFDSSEPSQNQPSARINRDTGRTLDRGIQLYRMWFNFLKLALELEELGVSLVTKQPTTITNWSHANPPIPRDVLEKSSNVEGGSKSAGLGGRTKIFRCRRVQKVKVKRSKYKGWDLDEVLTQPFDKWWKTHSHLFEGYYPSIIKSKDEWIEDPNFVYVRIDKTSQWTDVRNFMSDELSKHIKTDGRPRYKLSGKNPRVNVLQNNFNAIVLLIKGMSPKEICSGNKVYLRRTDEHVHSSRTKDERLTVPTVKGKPLYSTLVSKQKEMGIHHLFEVCEGRFGTVKPTK